jgi:soluble lytic murein transglycosylase-like protein
MISVQKAIFPGIALGCFFLVFIAGLIARPGVSLAENNPAAVTLPGDGNPGGDVSQDPAGQPVQEPIDAAAQAATVNANEKIDKPEKPQPAADTSASPKKENKPESQPECSLNSGYPDKIRQWCSLIEQAAGKYALDSNLVAAVMLQESGGNPKAYSKSGAVGLMQVMPRNGIAASFRCANGPCFASRPTMEELFDPAFNVDYGVRMLAGLIQKRGNIREGLKAYGPINMGYRYADIILNIMDRYD